ncbi:polyphosphoinositide phosphatase [Anthonomus grandis grandis]|uniref:polyphosphoinositide phosphatase n=1 Tax=Anthonomus grandis grandis TaxID=2921223 RepID=UPI0021652086|nr:polyphosphoinositide phosphatase [Anthonomus grandis grandis]
MDRNGTIFYPIISSIQKLALYETKSKYYLVGSNNNQTRFRVLKIDRTEPLELEIYDDKVEYSADEIKDLVGMIESGNRKAGASGISRFISAFGIVGFIKFLEGYYIILITKRRRVAVIGHHTLYKIEDTTMIYIPHESVRIVHPHESRYLKMFQSIDLASNFYFSYSYDLTHSLQHNLSEPKRFITRSADIDSQNDPLEKKEFFDDLGLFQSSERNEKDKETQYFGVRAHPHKKFVWNLHLLNEALKVDLHPNWILYITHGFVSQSNINVFGRPLYLTLIARRSSKYAGTRFLKRGANFQGDVANEVETEQIVHDSSVSSFSSSHFTSFVQMRGSIPGHWKQEMGKMVAKPAITIDFYDPFAETAGAHFNELLKRYGAPIVILNLVKKRERKPQESMLSEQMRSAVQYLNQFLPVEHQIVYKTFDMARKNKTTSNVMEELAGIAKNAVSKVGIFHNQKKYFTQKANTVIGKGEEKMCSKQTGIVRTNCVDCLDRTNTAQFAIGKCALGYQLCALGVLDTPNIEFDTDCVRMLESLYEDHGDTLALQYGGSQLVHRIKTYRKTAPWSSHGNDIMQTLSRYYSNTFSDAEKQNAINLFLGLFKPEENQPQIWDYASDYYFHHKPNLCGQKSLTQWWDDGVFKCLPYAYNDVTKACFDIIQVHSHDVEMIDSYVDYYRPNEFNMLTDVFALTISSSVDFMPICTVNYSPFAVRTRPDKRREGNVSKNPSVTGQSSTSSTTSTPSASSSENSSDDEESANSDASPDTFSKESSSEIVTFKSLFPSTEEVYGFSIKMPSKEDILTYKKYVLTGKRANGTAVNIFLQSSKTNIKAVSTFSNDDSFEVKPPTVSQKSIEIYKNYVNLGKYGPSMPKAGDMAIYARYASIK